MTSSKYIKHVSNLIPEKISAINRSKVLGCYVRAKGTTVHSYSPALVTKAALPMIGTRQYPEGRSNVLNHFAPESTLKESLMCGSR